MSTVSSSFSRYLMPSRVLLDIVTFHGVNAYRNVCRISPLDVELRSAPGTGSRFNFHYSSTPPVPLIAFSTMWLERSQLVAPADTGLRQRYITGKFFAQEWQRFMGFVATASGYDELHAQLARDALQFSTRAQASLSSPAGVLFSYIATPSDILTLSDVQGLPRRRRRLPPPACLSNRHRQAAPALLPINSLLVTMSQVRCSHRCQP